MQYRYIGWLRVGWRQWHAIIGGDDYNLVWFQLEHFFIEDEDGERVVLPGNETPVGMLQSFGNS